MFEPITCVICKNSVLLQYLYKFSSLLPLIICSPPHPDKQDSSQRLQTTCPKNKSGFTGNEKQIFPREGGWARSRKRRDDC